MDPHSDRPARHVPVGQRRQHWRAVLVTEHPGSDDAAVGQTTWDPGPHVLLGPDGRRIGTIERFWRQYDGEVAHVWAQGTLDPGVYELPEPFTHATWLADEFHAQFRAVEDGLRRNADAVCLRETSRWRLEVAGEMGCDIVDVGLAPVQRHRDNDALEESNFRVVLNDLRSNIDRRVTDVRFGGVTGRGWVEEIAVPLDNPHVVERVGQWLARLESHGVADERDVAALRSEYETRAVPLSGEPTVRDEAIALRHRLDSLGRSDPPGLAH